LNILFTFRIFEELALALKNRACSEFTVLKIHFLTFRNCACPEKQSLPCVHCIEYVFFINQNFEQIALALKIFLYLNIFHLSGFFSYLRLP